MKSTIAVLLMSVLMAGGANFQSGAVSDDARSLLGVLGFEAQEIQQAAAGTAVARIIKDSGDEAAQAGAVWIGMPPAFFVSRFEDIETFERRGRDSLRGFLDTTKQRLESAYRSG